MEKNYFRVDSKNNKITVETLVTPEEIKEAWKIDNVVFQSHQTVDFESLEVIASQGGLLGISIKGRLVGISSILLEPITSDPTFSKDTALCFGTAVLPEFRRIGYGYALAICQEIIARKYRKDRLLLSVRPENAPSILMRLNLGFKISGYDPNYFGNNNIRNGRLILVKNTVERINGNGRIEMSDYFIQVDCKIGDEIDISARQKLASLQSEGLSIIDYKIHQSNLYGIYYFKRNI